MSRASRSLRSLEELEWLKGQVRRKPEEDDIEGKLLTLIDAAFDLSDQGALYPCPVFNVMKPRSGGCSVCAFWRGVDENCSFRMFVMDAVKAYPKLTEMRRQREGPPPDKNPKRKLTF